MAAEKRKTLHHESAKYHQIKEIELPKSTTVSPKPAVILTNKSDNNFKKDLYRSLFISFIIILVEITIYLAQNKVIPVTNLF